MMQLFLNNELVDLFGDETIVGSYATNELGDLKSRQGVYSNTFKIPFTNRNRNVMQSAEIVTGTTLRPYQKLHARINVNGVPVVIGWGIITSASRTGYEVQVIGGNAEWYENINDASLQDINLDEFNHIFYVTDIDNTRSNNTNWTDCYVYPNAEWGRTLGQPDSTIDPDWGLLRAGVYGKYLLYRILTEAGFTPVGDWWDNNTLLFDPSGIVDSAGTASDKFASFIPFCGLWRRNKDYSLRNFFDVQIPNDVFINTLYSYVQLLYTNVNSYPTNGWSVINPFNNNITLLDSGTYEFNYLFKIKNESPTGTNLLNVKVDYVDQSGSAVSIYPYLNYVIGPGTTVNLAGNLFLNCSPCQLVISVLVTEDSTVFNDTKIELTAFTPVDDQDDEELNITKNFPFVTLNSTLPDVKQVDLLKWYIQKFNLIFTTDNQTGTINFVTLDDVLGNLPNAYDWSLKLDLMEEPTVSFIVGNYGQRSYFKDKRDENNDFTKDNLNYLEGRIDINDENLDAEVTIYETEFSPVYRQTETYNGLYRMGYVPKYKLLDETITNFDPNDDANFEELDCEPYMGLLRFEPYNLQVYTGLTPVADAPSVHGERITWNKMIPDYYQSLQSLLNYSKIVTCLIRLDESDINGLDFSRPVWIDYFNCYFYINKINQFHFTDRASTEVELIKINYDYDAGDGYGNDINNNLIWLQDFEFMLTENNNFITLENA